MGRGTGQKHGLLLVWRLPQLSDSGRPGAAVSRETAFLFNNLLFLAITFAVLYGTLYPLLVEAVSGQTVSVGAPWFDTVNVPIFLALLFLMGVGPALPWGAASWGRSPCAQTISLLRPAGAAGRRLTQHRTFPMASRLGAA